MDSKTPTKVLSRIHLTPTSKRILCVICGKQCENKHERLLLFNKGSKTSHCALIEKHLRIEILSSASNADHVCRNCIRKLVTIENNLSKLVNTFNATRENLQEKYGKYSKKRMFGDSEPTSKRPLFSTPGANQSHLDLVSDVNIRASF